MGDRGNIVLCDSAWNPRIYLYSHWGGSELHQDLRKALVKGKSRWDDPPYLHRVIFQAMLGDDAGVTGYGLDWSQGDNEYPLVLVNAEAQRVRCNGEEWSFGEFVA